jgi:hypothetical protein
VGTFSRWLSTVRRFLAFLWVVAVLIVRFLIIVLSQVIYVLVLQELVWRWWLGYGERPFRVLFVIVLVLLSTWLLYWQFGNFILDPGTTPPIIGQSTWQDALYYSLVSFFALGYGGWVSEPVGWAKWVGAVQPFIGIISTIALSIALTQRITR